MDSDSHISATACHNMGLIFSPDPFHYLFLTALVHPLSTCAYLLFLSHCNNYILPSHSRQPKLASCFILSSGWGIFPIAPFFLQPACLSYAYGWGIFPIPSLFPQPACLSYAYGWGIFPILPLFPKPACFSMASGWSIFPIPPIFPQPACKQACSDACAWAIITQKFTPRYVE